MLDNFKYKMEGSMAQLAELANESKWDLVHATLRTNTVYVALLGEGVDVWRPVRAEHVQGQLYRITGENTSPEDEKWEFVTGQIVRCVKNDLSDGPSLVAVEVVKGAV